MCGTTSITADEAAKIAALRAVQGVASESPYGPGDEIGMLNLMTPESIRAVLTRLDGGAPFDLSVDLFIGMPSHDALGDVPFQMWMSHTPGGTIVDDSMGLGLARNTYASYSGDTFMMYTHCGTHLDTLNHWGLHGKLWNGFTEHEHLGSRHWTVAGADTHPPITARGVLLDVARTLGADALPAGFAIGPREIAETLRHQHSEIRAGDVVLIRTGHMNHWPDNTRYLSAAPGITRAGAEVLAQAGAMIIGADTPTVEQLPTDLSDPSSSPVHTYLLAECGVCLLENANLEDLAREQIHEFGYVGAGLRLRGATGAPTRPLAFPLRRR